MSLKSKEQLLLKMATDLGRMHAYIRSGFYKEATGKFLPTTVGVGVGALAGALAMNAVHDKHRTQAISDQLRESMATLPKPLLAELMMQGMSPGMASHILSLNQKQGV